ncbi:MAG: hypothetical protein QW566_09130 [Candidatus Jordarchaeales archaeon]
MGVYHVSGLGLNPGGFTPPLSHVYLSLKAAREGDERAKRFFRFSGRGGGGKPEVIVVFTSREVITGEREVSCRDLWFNTQGKTATKVIARYLSSLLSHYGFQLSDLPEFYFIEVNYMDFEDCFRKAYPTLYAMRAKEVWVNMVGGTNQINAALLWSGCVTAVPSRYYYYFQAGQLLHPDRDKDDFFLDFSSWYELPFFSLKLGDIIGTLNGILAGGKASVAQLEWVLRNNGMDKQYIPKLVASRLVEIDDRGVVLRGEMLDYWDRVLGEVKSDVERFAGSVEELDFSRWKKWASGRGILYTMTEDGEAMKLDG